MVFDLFQPVGVYLTGLKRSQSLKDRDEVDRLAIGHPACRHRSTGNKNGRDVYTHRGH